MTLEDNVCVHKWKPCDTAELKASVSPFPSYGYWPKRQGSAALSCRWRSEILPQQKRGHATFPGSSEVLLKTNKQAATSFSPTLTCLYFSTLIHSVIFISLILICQKPKNSLCSKPSRCAHTHTKFLLKLCREKKKKTLPGSGKPGGGGTGL